MANNEHTSPGRTTGRRARLERQLQAHIEPGVATYITSMRDYTMTLADTGEPAHAAVFEDIWLDTVKEITGPLFTSFTAAEVEAMVATLQEASIAEYAYHTAAEVLNAAKVQSWSRAETRAAINEFLDPYQGGPAVAAVARARHQLPSAVITQGGEKWMVGAMREIRSLATEIVSERTMADIAAAGLPFKQWVSRQDKHTRPDHVAADGQVVPTSGKFLVGGAYMDAPGDSTAPGEQYWNCRCIVIGLHNDTAY